MTNFIKHSKSLISNTDLLEITSQVKYIPKSKSEFNLNLNLLQKSNEAKQNFFKEPHYFSFVQQTTSRSLRFVLSTLIVLVLSGLCFFLVKYSVDWANCSRTELNKMKASRLDNITREVKNNFSYIIATDA